MEYPINTIESTLHERKRVLHDKIANLSYNYSWSQLLTVLNENKSSINACRLSKSGIKPKLYTPLHQAAFGSASVEVIQELIGLKASRTLRTNERNETAYDIAARCNASEEILHLLKVPSNILDKSEVIGKMEKALHKIILGRSEKLVEEHQLQLPQLSFLYEFGSFWFPVPGMYGGFNVEKCEKGIQVESWCRVVGGSGQRHIIDENGHYDLVDEGFV